MCASVACRGGGGGDGGGGDEGGDGGGGSGRGGEGEDGGEEDICSEIHNGHSPMVSVPQVCVCVLITAVPIIKLFASQCHRSVCVCLLLQYLL